VPEVGEGGAPLPPSLPLRAGEGGEMGGMERV